MDAFEIVRRRASAMRLQASLDQNLSGFEISKLLAESKGYEPIALKVDDPLLQGAEAVLDRGVEAIFYRESAEPSEAATLIAHEIGHLVLHDGLSLCHARDLAGELSETDGDSEAGGAIHRLDSYGARERQELQANVFARELLLPRSTARALFLESQLGASQIRERLGLPLELVRQQLCDALLLPPSPEGESEAEISAEPAAEPVKAAALELDPSQRAAAEHRGSALLLEAGPGTGKTRTLVARVLHLIDSGVDPASILALTFSNKAAQEIVDRVSLSLADSAPSLFAGTFHAFGLEILRKHHDRVGLSPDLRVIDRADAIALLEDQLPTLGLTHHQNLYEPALDLKEMLAAVSRAKDELVDASGYEDLATAMLDRAADDKERVAAERALEVARVYRAYEKVLGKKGWVDFGDLVMVPTLLLEKEPALRTTLRLRYRHILVDEYQDVNRASARMLKALAGDGARLWVVGDSRQSIYRFRGASTANMRLFGDDFPAATRRALATSYRSTPEVVDTFCSFARTMKASEGMLPLELRAHRGAQKDPSDSADVPDSGRPVLVEAAKAEDEVAAVAGRIQELVSRGVPLREQAVLCRSNSQVQRFAIGLSARNLPVLHLGSLFERSEVRDLLSILSLVVDPRGGSLARVAAMDEYCVEAADVRIFLRAVQGEMEVESQESDADTEDRDSDDVSEGRASWRWTPLSLLRCLAELPDPRMPCSSSAGDAWRQYLLAALSDSGRRGLVRLAKDLDGISPTDTPWQIIAAYLLDRSSLLRRDSSAGSSEEGSSVSSEEALENLVHHAAIHQFLGFVKGARGHGRGFPAKRLLARVRRLVMLGEERDLRQMPASALHLNAVRLMTLHGSKGLEFEAVHLPSLSNGGLPSRFRSPRCPPPRGLIAGLEASDVDRMQHDAEEECLFFVAMSRARTYLSLSRSTTAGRGRSKPSPFLAALRPEPFRLVEPRLVGVQTETTSPCLEIVGKGELRRILGRDLSSYERCPRRFFYGRVLRLPGSRRDSAYQDTRNCLYKLMSWMRSAPPEMDAQSVKSRCDEIWQSSGPVGHAFEAQYRDLFGSLAEHLLAARKDLTSGSETAEDPLILDLNGHRVELQADLAGASGAGAPVLRLVRTGRQGSFKADQMIHGIWQQAVRESYGSAARVEVVHLADGSKTPVTLTQRQLTTRLDKGSRLLSELAQGKFPASVDPVSCPRCPYFFICPTVPGGPIVFRDPEEKEKSLPSTLPVSNPGTD